MSRILGAKHGWKKQESQTPRDPRPVHRTAQPADGCSVVLTHLPRLWAGFLDDNFTVTSSKRFSISGSGLVHPTLRIFCQAHNALQIAPAGGPHNETLVTNLERATKLLHITPALLQSSDGRCSRQGRYNEYARGELTGLIDWLMVFSGRSRQKAREDTPEARRIRASKLAHQRGGITKAASALISAPAAPRDSRTLATLRGKHPTEDPSAIATGKAQAERRTGITAVGEQEQQPCGGVACFAAVIFLFFCVFY